MTGRSALKFLRGESYTGRQYLFAERGRTVRVCQTELRLSTSAG
jgi:hypothetical protein